MGGRTMTPWSSGNRLRYKVMLTAGLIALAALVVLGGCSQASGRDVDPPTTSATSGTAPPTFAPSAARTTASTPGPGTLVSPTLTAKARASTTAVRPTVAAAPTWTRPPTWTPLPPAPLTATPIEGTLELVSQRLAPYEEAYTALGLTAHLTGAYGVARYTGTQVAAYPVVSVMLQTKSGTIRRMNDDCLPPTNSISADDEDVFFIGPHLLRPGDPVAFKLVVPRQYQDLQDPTTFTIQSKVQLATPADLSLWTRDLTIKQAQLVSSSGEYPHIIGSIQNTGNKPLEYLAIYAFIYYPDGRLRGTSIYSWSWANNGEGNMPLAPGAELTFNMQLSDHAVDMSTYRFELVAEGALRYITASTTYLQTVRESCQGIIYRP